MESFLQKHGTALGMKIAVSFANIFMAEIEKKLIQQSETKPKEWKRNINDVFSFWDCDRKEINRFIKRANYFHPTIKFTGEISENQPNPFSRYHGVQRGRIRKKFHLEHQDSSEVDRDSPNYTLRLVPPTRRKIWFIKGKQEDFQELALRKKIFEVGRLKFKQSLKARGYPESIIERCLSGVNFAS